MKTFKSVLCVILASVMCLVCFAGCNKKEEINQKNETQALVLQGSTFDGVFSPFFYSSAYDGEVVGLIDSALLTMDPSGAIVAGDEYPTVAKSYSIYFTDAEGNVKETYPEGGNVVYEMVIKNGMKFSDGTAITAEDVLFNYYVYLDAAYDGSSTLYTIPILGMQDYKLQIANSASYIATANAILKAGKDHEWKSTDSWTKEQQDFYWTTLAANGAKFAQSITDYVLANYSTDEYVKDYIDPSKTAADLSNVALANAFGMRMWGFGSFVYSYVANAEGTFVGVKNEDGTFTAKSTLASALANEAFADFTEAADGKYVKTEDGYVAFEEGMQGTRYNSQLKADFVVLAKESLKGFRDALGTSYTLEGNDYPTAETYFSVMAGAYEGDYANLEETENTGTCFFINPTAENYASKFAEAGTVSSISGIKAGTKKIDGTEYETVSITLTEQNPKAILSLGVTVAPKAYYTKGYTYKEGAVVTAGVELNSTAFMDHLKTFNLTPVGSGPYKMAKGPNGAFYEDNVVYFERNEQFDTMGGDNVYNTKIKYVNMKVVSSGAEYDALDSDTVMYATVSATTDVMEDLKTSTKLEGVLVDNNGYGYICINPIFFPNVNTRIALTSLLNLDLIENYYPNGLAEVIYRASSKVSWAYPENATAMYPFDETKATAKTYFEKAGFTFADGVMIDPATGEQASFVFTLPSDTDAHPAGAIFIRARELLMEMGAKAEIKTDENLIANIKTSTSVGIYALAWQSAADPDMYQVYHYNSQATSVWSNGITTMYSGGKSEHGTISVTKLDGTTVEMNQTEAVTYLGELIEEGVKYMLADERAPIYTKALDLVSQLSFEIPTYQRKNLFVFNKEKIDATTLSSTVSPYWGPLAEIWKVSFTKDAK